MVDTGHLVELARQVRSEGGRMLLVGDPQQLAAVGRGGAFGLLLDRHGGAELHEIRRFEQAWERAASKRLRDRDPAAIDEYVARGRIHHGPGSQVEDDLFEAWSADARDPSRVVSMIVSTNDQAARLGERARQARLATGHVGAGATVQLRDNHASVGDHIVTRRNDRRLTDAAGQAWVVNGDVWTVAEIRDGGAVVARRHHDDAHIELPADYLAEHAHLGYAITAHRAQGMTVDVAHALVGPDDTHQRLYVAATRGRTSNHLWVTTDPPAPAEGALPEAPTPEQVLDRILTRRDLDSLAAHQVLDRQQQQPTSLAQLVAVYDDLVGNATSRWLADQLAARGLAYATNEREWPALVAQLRASTLAGHDPQDVLAEALQRPLDDVASVAAVLHWRIGQYRTCNTFGSTSVPAGHGQGPDLELAGQLLELIGQRRAAIRRQQATDQPARHVLDLIGPRPDRDHERRESWLDAASAITAYREQHQLAAYVPGIGPRPSDTRPAAQAAFDQTVAAVDRHNALRLEQLDHRELEQLAARQQAVIDRRPHHDPEKLQQAHALAETLRRTPHVNPASLARQLQAVHRLENRAVLYRRWQRDAAAAERVIAAIAARRQTAAATMRRT